VGKAIGFARIAHDARAHDVFPGRLAAAIARDDMVEIEFLAREPRAAILTDALSRSNTLLRVSFSSLQGSLSKNVSRITRGNRIVRVVCGLTRAP